jgi:hypothetical protein
VWQGRTGDRPPYADRGASVEFNALGRYIATSVCSSFVLRCYANVVIPLKPLLGPSMFGRGVAQPG